MNQGEGRVKSVVPITGRGIIKYLPHEFLPEEMGKPKPKYVLKHKDAITLYIGKIIKLGGYAAHFECSAAVERWDGEIVLINPLASMVEGVVELTT